MDTVGGIIRAAMRKARILAPGEPIPDDEGPDAKEAFTLMVDAWSTEQLLIPIVSEVTHLLQSNASIYTIGIHPTTPPEPLTHIETPRPLSILSAFIRDEHETDYIQEVIDVETFSRISRKTNGSRPSRFYVRKGWPLNTILFESVPYADETLHLDVIQPLAGILPTANLTDAVFLPEGYKQTLIYNLAIVLADEWGKSVTNTVAVMATEGKKWLKRNNGREITLGMDRAVATQRRGIGTYIIEQGP